ncbi:DUF4124 domain-containing protein [Ottowia thiooxydans]|uniref:DUF4124 domain-containing protein n=1 Tax=Ottowia thiooxydans TaxID=219182 RepID=UPI000687B0FD|nr:DUF4124 domain-containing protein [Ottowia thiooxydans]
MKTEEWMNARAWISGATLMALFANTGTAQVYRCEVNGKASYSDEPCLGAKRVDVTPTRGLDKLSGKSQKSQEVRREELNKDMAAVERPLLRQTPEERATWRRRARNHLTPEEMAECYVRDPRIEGLEKQEKTAKGVELQQVQQQLLKERQRQRKLKC